VESDEAEPMISTRIERQGNVAVLTLARGKVNAIDEATADELREQVSTLERDPDTRAVVLAGQGSFFSFGFDVPALYDYSPADFTRFLTKFTGLYRALYTLPKPLVAAVNGHAVAGGFMLATTADHRIMATGKAKISLNEITFGASLFSGSVEMLRAIVGDRRTETIALEGAMYGAEDAWAMGLVDEVATSEAVVPRALEIAAGMAARDQVAYAAIKRLLRAPVLERLDRAEQASIASFVEIWYSPSTRAHLRQIRIRA